MNPEIETKIDHAIREAVAHLSPQSREQLSFHIDREARDALSAFIREIEPELIVALAAEAALERFRSLGSNDNGNCHSHADNPFHTNYRPPWRH